MPVYGGEGRRGWCGGVVVALLARRKGVCISIPSSKKISSRRAATHTMMPASGFGQGRRVEAELGQMVGG